MNHTPSYLEFQGLYNVDPNEWSQRKSNAEFDADSFLLADANLPRLTWQELEHLSAAIYKVLSRFPPRAGLTQDEVRKSYRYCVGDELIDRTARVEMPQFDVLTAELIHQLQSDVLHENLLWRIMIVGESPETVVMIYPGEVRIANFENGDLAFALAETIAQEKNLRESRDGPGHRQMGYLARFLPDEVSRWQDADRFRVIVAFDNYQGNKDEVSLWILHARKIDYIWLEQPKNSAQSIWYPVSDKGSIGVELDDSNNAPYRIRQFVIPIKDYAGKLVVCGEDYDTDEIVRSNPLPLSPIISDAR